MCLLQKLGRKLQNIFTKFELLKILVNYYVEILDVIIHTGNIQTNIPFVKDCVEEFAGICYNLIIKIHPNI